MGLIDIVPGEWILQGGAGALLAVTVWMILTERLVPGRRVKRIEDERDTWQHVALKAMGHADALLPGAQVATEMVRALGSNVTPQDARRPRTIEEDVSQALGDGGG